MTLVRRPASGRYKPFEFLEPIENDLETRDRLLLGHLDSEKLFARLVDIPDIKVKGKQYDLKELERYMQTIADTKREGDGGPGSPSAVYVLIRADRNTPWQHVQYVMQVCAQPHVAIYKMQFATTKRDDGKASP